MKNLIIFHYHFLPGGVTDVVSSAVISYLKYSREIDKITIVSGRSQNLEKMEKIIRSAIDDNIKGSLSFDVLESLDYYENLDAKINSHTILNEIEKRYASEENIWWIHNYHLGKNPYFTKALLEISRSSEQKMIFHIHDFPECSRYALLQRLKEYINGDLYPETDHIKYAVINSRDYRYLSEAGLNEKSLFLLENPIKISEISYKSQNQTKVILSGPISKDFPAWKPGESYMLYPVRAIRRKNITEAALLATLSEKNIIITLPGESETEKRYSEKCKKLFLEGQTPGMFGIGFSIENYNITFDELIASSSLIISSSIQEGFGYLFLNSMNWGKPLLARDLDILASFKPSFKGYDSYFYNQISVPLELDEKNEILELYLSKINRIKTYLSKKKIHDLQAAFKTIFEAEYTDFSFLTLNKQIQVLDKINKHYKYKIDCIKINKKVLHKIDEYITKETSPNHDILNKFWSLESYNRNFELIIQSFISRSSTEERIKAKRLIYETMVSSFATPEYLRLIYDE